MSIFKDITECGGSQTPNSETKFYVSLWYIPGGCDYNNARVVKGYFAEEEKANEFANKYIAPPEMAMVCHYVAATDVNVNDSN